MCKMIFIEEVAKKKVSGTYRKFAKFQCENCGNYVEKRLDTPPNKCKVCYRANSKSVLYPVWQNMKSRCLNPNTESYSNYGARGITICDEWSDSFEVFEKWAILNGYNKNLTIDRINNDGNYDPFNCRWVSRTIQARNTRVLKSTNMSGYRGC